ncbi:hypothetical protein WN55_09573 [Dufourea novaeangliae]|uniref:Uncharacterized protein n=1 Tax=Dufourea novaeangliae TaxID=178035 RepID=A0A154P095_DUFNO|nr:hypothetical protein WN55_09573 [Dufourea novaeangliae]
MSVGEIGETQPLPRERSQKIPRKPTDVGATRSTDNDTSDASSTSVKSPTSSRWTFLAVEIQLEEQVQTRSLARSSVSSLDEDTGVIAVARTRPLASPTHTHTHTCINSTTRHLEKRGRS